MVRNLKVVNTEKNDTENEFSVSLCLQSEAFPEIQEMPFILYLFR